MTASIDDALDKNWWQVGSRRAGSNYAAAVDLYPTLVVGLSSIDPRIVRGRDEVQRAPDASRLAIMRPMVQGIRVREVSLATKAHLAQALKRFVRWADDLCEPLQRETVVQLMSRCDACRPAQILAVKRLAAETLDLSAEERGILLPVTRKEKAADDSWSSTIEYRGSRRCDFLRLAVAGDACLRADKFAELRSRRLEEVSGAFVGRADLMGALRDEFRALLTAKLLTHASLAITYATLRTFVVWADTQKWALDKSSAVNCLISYSQDLMRQWRAKALSTGAVRSRLDMLLLLISGALEIPIYSLRLKIAMPPIGDSGFKTARPDPRKLREFCGALHAIVQALPSDKLCNPITSTLQIILCIDGEEREQPFPLPYTGLGDRGVDPRIANLPLTRLRVWIELHRFIAFTGCNLSVAMSLTVGKWVAERQTIMSTLKPRANKFVSVRVGEQYARHVDAHIEFLRAVLPVEVSDDVPLFPTILTGRMGARTIMAAARARALTMTVDALDPGKQHPSTKWLSSTKLTVFTARTLRLAKSSWLLRRYNGDSLRVSESLGNTPQVTFRSYGGKGNLELAVAEWSGLWAEPAETQASLAPGGCSSPGTFEPTRNRDEVRCSEGGCLVCRHYRGEDSLDYIHRLLSYRHCLAYRAQTNEEIVKLLLVIDQIVDAYKIRHPHETLVIDELRAQIGQNPHPNFAAMIQLVEIAHGA